MEKRKALIISFFAIASVVFVEGVSGLITGSLAILSDVAHALFDAVTSLILLVTTSWSLKPPDEEHMYGHEKIEAIGGFVAGMSLIALGGFIAFNAFSALIGGVSLRPEFVGFVGIAYTFCIDILRIGVLRSSEGSVTVEAGLYHALADFASTLIALLGFGLATMGFHYGDPVASLILSASLVYLSSRLVWKSALELSDAISSETARKIREQILSTPGVSRCRELKVRKAGAKVFVEATVTVPEQFELKDAHVIASKIESKISKTVGVSVPTIHIEPEEEQVSQRQIKDAVGSVEGVKRVHNISCSCRENELFITLHAQMDPKVRLRKAHRITEEIEARLKSEIPKVKHVTVHIEPYTKGTVDGAAAKEEDIHKMVAQALHEYPDFGINGIVTYLDKGKRHININCSFASDTPIDTIHDRVSEAEKKIRKLLDNAVVTIHVEPKKPSKDR